MEQNNRENTGQTLADVIPAERRKWMERIAARVVAGKHPELANAEKGSAAYRKLMMLMNHDIIRQLMTRRAPPWMDPSKYKPHQGAEECRRRRERMWTGEYSPEARLLNA